MIDNEGWQHTDQTDLFAIHNYENPGCSLSALQRRDARGMSFPKADRDALLPGYRYNGSPLCLSEFGSIAYIPPGTNVPGASWDYSGVANTQESALNRLTQLMKVRET